MDPIVLLSLIVFVPTIGAFLLLLPGIFSKENPDHMRSFTFAVTVITFGLTVWLAAGYDLDATAADAGKMQLVLTLPSIELPWEVCHSVFVLRWWRLFH